MAYDETLAARLRRHLDGQEGLAEKKMFGGIGFLLDGNMTCGVWKEELILRLDPEAALDALDRPHTRVFDITGRPMKGWILVAPGGTAGDQDLRSWVDQAVAFVRTLPKK